MKQDLLSFASWETSQVTALIELALEIKNAPERYQSVLAGKSIVGVFEKPSLRTHVSFNIGINKLGGHFVYLDSKANHLEGREAVADTAANLGCWADAIVGRVFKHSTLEGFTAACDIPVINALCDLYHPCQALADYLTMTETFGDVSQTKLAYIGDGNNVTHSLLIVAAHLGAEVIAITPEGFEVDKGIFEQAQHIAKSTGAKLSYSNNLNDAKGANVLYTDTWLSMGDDTPLNTIKQTFMPYQINQQLLELTGASHVMHCQPAHRDLEITSEVMDSKHSLLLQQAENRMHAQNAILATLLG